VTLGCDPTLGVVTLVEDINNTMLYYRKEGVLRGIIIDIILRSALRGAKDIFKLFI
jgi:hypothetical protein